MGLLSKLFNRKEMENQQENQQDEIQQNHVQEELFVDNEEPAFQADLPKSPLTIFMELDYSVEGYNDGYNFHDKEVLETKMTAIKSEFRMVLDRMICSLDSEINELQKEILSVDGVFDDLKRKIEVTKEKLVQEKKWLNQEKMNSAIDEGVIAKHLSSYRDSFRKGMMVYFEEKHFAQSTGLFN